VALIRFAFITGMERDVWFAIKFKLDLGPIRFPKAGAAVFSGLPIE
jgi:hypothetical protein